MARVHCSECNQPIDAVIIELGGNKCPSCGGKIKFEKATDTPDGGQIHQGKPSKTAPLESSRNDETSADETRPADSGKTSKKETLILLSSFARRRGFENWELGEETFEEWELSLLRYHVDESPDEAFDEKALMEIGFQKETIDKFANDIQRIGPKDVKTWVKDGRMTFFTTTGNVLTVISILMLVMIGLNIALILSPDPSTILLLSLSFLNILAVVSFFVFVGAFNSDAKDLNEFLYRSR